MLFVERSVTERVPGLLSSRRCSARKFRNCYLARCFGAASFLPPLAFSAFRLTYAVRLSRKSRLTVRKKLDPTSYCPPLIQFRALQSSKCGEAKSKPLHSSSKCLESKQPKQSRRSVRSLLCRILKHFGAASAAALRRPTTQSQRDSERLLR